MLKDKKHIISCILFGIAIFLFFFVDIYQNDLEFGGYSRKVFVFTSWNIIKILLLIFITLKTDKIIKFSSYSWMSYEVEIIYDRFFNEGEFEVYSWLIPVFFISIYLFYYLHKHIKNGRND